MRGCTPCASGVRYVCRRMNVRYLNRSAENQQQSAVKSQGDLPGASRVLFDLLIGHHSNYNVRLVQRLASGACAIKTVT